MRNFIREPRIIKVNGEEEYFLSWWISDSGIIVEVSGPKSLVLIDNEITEFDGSPLKLER